MYVYLLTFFNLGNGKYPVSAAHLSIVFRIMFFLPPVNIPPWRIHKIFLFQAVIFLVLFLYTYWDFPTSHDCQLRFWWYPHQVGCGYNRHLHGIYAVAQEIGGSKFTGKSLQVSFRWKDLTEILLFCLCREYVLIVFYIYIYNYHNIHIHIYIYVYMYLISQASIDFSWFDILHLYVFRPVGNVFLSASGRARSATLAESTAMGQPASCGIEHRRLTQRKWWFNGDLTENMVIHWDMFMRFNGFR